MDGSEHGRRAGGSFEGGTCQDRRQEGGGGHTDGELDTAETVVKVKGRCNRSKGKEFKVKTEPHVTARVTAAMAGVKVKLTVAKGRLGS